LSKTIIITYPNLQINLNTLSFSPEPAENTTTTLSVEIYNDGNGFASNVVVVFKTDNETIGTKTVPKINAKSTAIVSLDWYLPVGYGGTRNVSVQITSSTEGSVTDEMKTSIYVKFAPKLVMDSKLWFYDEENNFITSTQNGATILIRVNITNLGDIDASEFNVDFYLDGTQRQNYIGKTAITKVQATSTVICEYRWTVQVSGLDRNHTIYARVNNTAMNASNSIFVEKLTLTWDPAPYISTTYNVNQEYVIIGKVSPAKGGSLQPGIYVRLRVTDTNGNEIGNYIGTIDESTGQFSIQVKFDKPGTYNFEIIVNGTEVNELRYPVPNVSIVGGTQGGFPSMMLWLIILIIVIVVVVVVVFLLISKMGIGKLGECGECGAPIPENATKCPKCGAEFETSTVRCSECGAWIPATAKTCPECGTVFTGKKVEATSYEKTMRQQYEAYVDKYRAQAKREMGASFSETAFWRWWRTQPSYMTYNQWLHKEEAARKETTKCPSCGAINEKGAKICYRCGTAIAPARTPTQPAYTPPGPEYRPPQQQAYQPPAPVYAPPTQPSVPPPRAPTPAYAPPPSKPVVLKSTPPQAPPAAPVQQPPVPPAPVPPKKVIKRPEAVEQPPERPVGKLCPKCGKEISAEFVVCPYCGAIVR
ncbi:MAG: zinc-ribbon domain-containing protein, partial [Thermoplasmata archaeon]